MSYFPPGRLDTSPFLDAPPPVSPWRIRARDLHRRSALVRPFVLLCVFCAFAVPVWLFTATYRAQDPLVPISEERPLAPTPARHQAWPNVPHRHSVVAAAPTSVPVHDDDLAQPPPPAPVQPAPDPVTFSLIMWSVDAANEGAVLIKSILMYASGPTHIHIICDDAAQEYVQRRLALVTHPRYDVLVRFYKPSRAEMEARVEREGSIATIHSAGTAGLMKLFIHEILPDTVQKTIFVDTDAFFISDPALLWQQFATFAPGTAISMPSHPDQHSETWLDANKICSCVMLLDLAALRAAHLMDSSAYRAAGIASLSPPTFRALFGAPNAQTGKYDDVWLGDQSYWWAIVSARPDVYQHLSYDWEISSCLVDMYITGLGDQDMPLEEQAVRQHDRTKETPHAGQAVTPRLLHFNCMNTDNYYDWDGWSDPHDSLNIRWGPAVRYHVGYKWTWLNQDRSDATRLTIETEDHVQFADLRYAAAHH